MMNSQEYETALREGTPIVTLIFSDASYGLIKWKQMDHFGHNCFVDFQNPDFVKYAESMHAKGYRVMFGSFTRQGADRPFAKVGDFVIVDDPAFAR